MPTNKNASIRYQTLNRCFRNKYRRYYIDDLVEECENALYYYNGEGGISKRQIFEDIKFMESEAGWRAPLRRVQDGKKVYYTYADHNFSINAMPLSDQEAKLLRRAIVTLQKYKGIPTYEWVQEVITALEWRFNIEECEENIIGFEQNLFLKGLEWLAPVIEAAHEHHPINIKYRNYKNQERLLNLTVHPWYVKQFNNRWFLFAANELYLSDFALDRIEGLEVLKHEPFMENEKVDFDHFFDDVIGVTIPDENVTTETIILRFTAKQFPYIASKPLHPSQKILDPESGTLQIRVRRNYELDQLILSFGPDVEVLAPESYRNIISQKIKQCAEKYSAVQIDCTGHE